MVFGERNPLDERNPMLKRRKVQMSVTGIKPAIEVVSGTATQGTARSDASDGFSATRPIMVRRLVLEFERILDAATRHTTSKWEISRYRWQCTGLSRTKGDLKRVNNPAL